MAKELILILFIVAAHLYVFLSEKSDVKQKQERKVNLKDKFKNQDEI